MARELYIAAYDVSSPKRLREMLRIVRSYATGGQKSVYECFLTQSEAGDLMANTAGLLDEATDRFLLLRLGPGTRVVTLGVALPPVDPPFFYQT